MIRTRSQDWRQLFDDANRRGAARFGTLWLQATTDMVTSFRELGLGDLVERDYQVRSAVARALYRALSTATKHPNNLARAKRLAEEEAAQRREKSDA